MEPQRDKLKLIVRNLELLVDALKAELALAEAVQVKVTKFSPPIDGDCASVAVVMKG